MARVFHVFHHSLMISLHRIPPIAVLCIFIGATQQVRALGRGNNSVVVDGNGG